MGKTQTATKPKGLIIAEKPSVARDIAQALAGRHVKNEGYLEGPEYVITWSIGHLLGLVKPEAYDKKYSRWLSEDLPIIPDRLKVTPHDAKAKKQLNVIRDLAKRADVDRIVIATDPAREGEHIGRLVLEYTGSKKPAERLWISSMTKVAIQDGMKNLRPLSEYDDLADAASCRAEADWLVGMNATRAATLASRGALGSRVVSLGRVQTPTLAILAQREAERRAHVAEKYSLLFVDFTTADKESYVGSWFDPAVKGDRATWLADEKAAEAVWARVDGKDGVIQDLKSTEKKEIVPLLFDLTALQREANKLYGYSAKQTLSIAQRLYETHKLLTYPRTNSRYLTSDLTSELKNRATLVGALAPYAGAAKYINALTSLPVARLIDDSKVSDHHAIIPTEADPTAIQPTLDAAEAKIYDLVVKRYLAAFYPPARWQHTSWVTLVDNDHFRTKGRVLTDPGWRQVYGTDAGESLLPDLGDGDTTHAKDHRVDNKETQPPPYYTEATLLGAMETAGRDIDDEALREIMKDSGLGTPATRAGIIELLIARAYVLRSGKELHVTAAGWQIIQALGEHELTSATLTGSWESKLGEVATGKYARATFMQEIRKFTTDSVKTLLEIDRENLKPERAEIGPCPVCAKKGLDNIIKENSKAYGCTSWESAEKPGCGTVIWKVIAGRPISPQEARELLETGETSTFLNGFRSRKGKRFKAKLLYKNNKVEMEFPPDRYPKKEENGEEDKAGDKKPVAPKAGAKKAVKKKPAAKKATPKKKS